ncbi:MAG: hypothetical protein ACW99A_17355 [Candidatus Kariarchaeaceae archaeon]|jgi:tetratricopeptide (TPR) repeat protein
MREDENEIAKLRKKPNHELFEISKPKVRVDGKIVNFEPPNSKKISIKGKTLDVYYYLIRNEGYHGVREIQRALGYTSPNLAKYHLNKLLEAQAVSKNEYGQYGLIKDEVKLGSLEEHINFLAYWIPRTIVFSAITAILGIFGLIYMVFEINSTLYVGILVGTCFVISGFLISDSLKMVNKYQNPEMKQDTSTMSKQTEMKNSLFQAITLVKSDRVKDRFEAQNILEEIILSDCQNDEITILAMLNLCDLLLDELKLNSSEAVLEEVIELSSKIYSIASQQNSTLLSVETLLLQHKFELISGRLDIAREKLDTALQIVQEEGIDSLYMKVKAEISSYEDQLDHWINPTALNMIEKIEKSRLTKYIDNAISLVKL